MQMNAEWTCKPQRNHDCSWNALSRTSVSDLLVSDSQSHTYTAHWCLISQLLHMAAVFSGEDGPHLLAPANIYWLLHSWHKKSSSSLFHQVPEVRSQEQTQKVPSTIPTWVPFLLAPQTPSQTPHGTAEVGMLSKQRRSNLFPPKLQHHWGLWLAFLGWHSQWWRLTVCPSGKLKVKLEKQLIM